MPARVLVVDDNVSARVMLKEMLEIHSHQVIAEADNLSGTLKAYQEKKPDLVTLDLSLTQEDGITILKALRQADKNAKVIIISGNSQKKVQEIAMAAGASGFLGKPIEMDELIKMVKKICP